MDEFELVEEEIDEVEWRKKRRGEEKVLKLDGLLACWSLELLTALFLERGEMGG